MIGAGINKFLSDVAELVESRKLPDVVDISNQSSKEGIRIVLELKKTRMSIRYGISYIRRRSWRILTASTCWPSMTAGRRP